MMITCLVIKQLAPGMGITDGLTHTACPLGILLTTCWIALTILDLCVQIPRRLLERSSGLKIQTSLKTWPRICRPWSFRSSFALAGSSNSVSSCCISFCNPFVLVMKCTFVLYRALATDYVIVIVSPGMYILPCFRSLYLDLYCSLSARMQGTS